MRIALLSDIHANREALAACLAHASRGGVERYVFLGDHVGYGADPAWVVDTVAAHVERGAVALLGNHDEAVLADTLGMNEYAARAIEWTRHQLDADHLAFLADLPLVHEEDDRLFVHADPAAPAAWGYITDLFTAARALTATRARATFCGHTHVPAVFHMSMTGKFAGFQPIDGVEIALASRRRWLAVIGAVGQPRDRNPAACYGVLDDAQDTLTYVRVPYDIATAAAKIRRVGLPTLLSRRLFEGY